MLNNKIIKGSDIKVNFEFTFEGEFGENGLDNFVEIVINIGDETYSTINNPADFYKDGPLNLVLDISDTTQLVKSYYIPEIIGYNNDYDDGYPLTGPSNNRLGNVLLVC